MHRPLLSCAFALLLSLAVGAPAGATSILVSFTGTVSSVNPDLAAAFTVGDAVSGSFLYDSTTPDSQPGDPDLGEYAGAPSNASFLFGSYLATGATGSILVDLNPNHAFIANLTGVAGATVGSFVLSAFTFRMIDNTATALFDDSLPVFLDPADFGTRQAFLGFGDGQSTAFVIADLSSVSVTAVPEPGIMGLVAGGLALLAARARRRR